MIKCGDCEHFVRDGKCGWYQTTEGKQKHPFGYAPFWVWSDVHSDKEQVHVGAQSACVTFSAKPAE